MYHKHVTYSHFVALMKGIQDLECNPSLLNGSQEWACAYAVIQAILHILTNYKSCFLSQLQPNNNEKSR
jgi:hypothetical protein